MQNQHLHICVEVKKLSRVANSFFLLRSNQGKNIRTNDLLVWCEYRAGVQSLQWKWRLFIAVIFQFKQMEGRSLKNIRASTGFVPVTSTIPERSSTNRAVKPRIGSEVNLLSSYLPVQWNDVKYIWSPYCTAQ